MPTDKPTNPAATTATTAAAAAPAAPKIDITYVQKLLTSAGFTQEAMNDLLLKYLDTYLTQLAFEQAKLDVAKQGS